MAHSTVKNILRGAWFLAIIVVVVGSVLPSDSDPIKALDSLDISDKFEHFAAYAVLGLLPAVHERRRVVIACVVGVVGLGIALEYVQLFSGWRDFEIGDMIANGVGVIVGGAVGLVVRSTRPLRVVLSKPAAKMQVQSSGRRA